MNRTTFRLIIGLIILAFVLAIGYWYYALSEMSLNGYYEVTDGFSDATNIEVATVSFVRVNEYDSAKIGRVSELLSNQEIEQKRVALNKRRIFLYHFYVAGDTAPLSAEMVEELAYTHPSITDASDILQVVPSGWIARLTFEPNKQRPRQVEIRHSQFYKTRAGIKAKDLR
ncbi:MAG: hypothetical protein HYX66_01215 [Ignavibacteria bacterium]|nr:hypothetical protein [Ignavibacteria bacterium]